MSLIFFYVVNCIILVNSIKHLRILMKTKLLMKYVIGTNNIKVYNTRIWELQHDGSCESFKDAWKICEQNEKQDFKKIINTDYPDVQVNRSSNDVYKIGNQEVCISDITILHREDIA